MASIVIVTKQCYLICEAINFIVINETDNNDHKNIFATAKKARKAKKPTKAQLAKFDNKQFQIVIDFVPVGGVNNGPIKRSSNDESTSVAINITGREQTLNLFTHMVEQIREQIPDHVFMDKMVDDFLQEVGKHGHTS